MVSIAKNAHDTKVLETCSKTLELLCVQGSAIFTCCDIARRTLFDVVVGKYKEAVCRWRSIIEGEEIPDEDVTFSVVTSVKKISIFSQCHDMSHWNVWESLFQNISDSTKERKELPEEAVKHSISACFFGVLWELRHVETVEEEGGDATHNVTTLETHLSSFREAMKETLLVGPRQAYKEEAYLAICDLLVIFSERLASDSTLVDLLYVADRTLQIMLLDFLQTYVFIAGANDEQDMQWKIDLQKRRNFLSSFCKLIVYNIIPTKAAADVFKHYIMYYNEFGDLIKLTMGKVREINEVNCARTMVLSLTLLFKDLQKRDGDHINCQSEEFQGIKELARRFAMMFGLDAAKNRQAIAAMHREGILFAVAPVKTSNATEPPPNLSFLEILEVFSSKLQKQDKQVMVKFLDRRIRVSTKSAEEKWKPLLQYRNSLVYGKGDQHHGSPRTQGRKRMEGGDNQSDDADDASDQSGSPPQKHKRLSSRKERLPVKVTPHPRLRVRRRIVSPPSSTVTPEGSISSAYSGESRPPRST